MKKIFSIAVLLISLSVSAQGNLQFNQVKLVTATETVPAGKVWKVESIIFQPLIPIQGTGNIFNMSNTILINGVSRQVRVMHGRDFGSGNAGVNYWEQKYPIWLPAGTSLAIGSGVAQISLIEFNVVP